MDLKKLEKGLSTYCYDGRIRKLRAFVMYFTADWPAASKVLGYVGHTGSLFCRFCLKERIYVRECRCLCAVLANQSHVVQAVRGRDMYGYGDIVEMECGRRREASEVGSVWRQLGSKNRDDETKKKLIREYGIKRDSCMGQFSLDYVFSFPYDVMHLILLGWTKQVLRLLTGTHPRHERLSEVPGYCIPSSVLQSITKAIESCTNGIPTVWGRAPLSLEYLSRFKAEDFKRHSEMYLLPFLHLYKVRKDIMLLWNQTRQPEMLSFRYKCDAWSVTSLRRVVAEWYAKYVRLFCVDRSSLYCLTPTTHTILHLPELFKQCGPLPVTSQFLIERLLGQIGKRVQQTSNISSHLFHKNFKLLALKLANDGKSFTNAEGDMRTPDVTRRSFQTSSQHVPQFFTGASCHGAGKPYRNLSNEQRRAVNQFVADNFPRQGKEFVIVSLKEFSTVTVNLGPNDTTIETVESHKNRSITSSRQARQKYCIAAHFASDHLSHCSLSTGSRQDSDFWNLYYGTVLKIIEVCLHAGEMNVIAVFVDVQWQLDLVQDQSFDLLYTERKGRGQKMTQHSRCIQRVIGFLDVEGQRYYIDPVRFEDETAGRTSLKGVLKKR